MPPPPSYASRKPPPPVLSPPSPSPPAPASPVGWIPNQAPRRSTFFVPQGSRSNRLADPAPSSNLGPGRRGSPLVAPTPMMTTLDELTAATGPLSPLSFLLPSDLASPRGPLPASGQPFATSSYFAAATPASLNVANGSTSTQPTTTATATPTSTKVPIGQSSSIMLHSGFWDLLSATGSRFYSPSRITQRALGARERAKGLVETERVGRGIASAPRNPKAPVEGGKPLVGVGVGGTGLGSNDAETGMRKPKRISVDMVGHPKAFAHLVHASSAEEAEALLMRWHLDRQGKLGQPSWAKPIKNTVKHAREALGVAEAIHARDSLIVAEQRQQRAEQGDVQGVGALHVVNGLPDSAFTTTETQISIDTALAVENDASNSSDPAGSPQTPDTVIDVGRSGSPETILVRESIETTRDYPLVDPAGTTKFSPTGWARPGVPLSWDRPDAEYSYLPMDHADESEDVVELSDPFALPPRFVPSLTTIDKAVSTKVYLETKYHALLKTPPSRQTRKHLLEKELSRLTQLSPDQKDEVRAAWRLSETEYLREMRSRVGVGSFVKLKTIGRGAFGVVSLVRERGSGELYAMKQLRKADMLRKGQEGHIRAERDLLASAATSTRWTVRLAYSFQDSDNLYLVMSFMAGGDLLTLLIEKDTFPESFARFYIAEMVLAIQETHQVLGAIHRDIKPDNFLFDAQGHIAISDYGLATDFHWSHDGAYYDNQRRELLYRHGVDLEDGANPRARRDSQPFDPPRPGDFDDDGATPPPPGSLLGWRDQGRRRMAYSVVGTNNYMAVEVLRGGGYTVSADWWSLGVICFEMLYGYPPFVSKSRQQTRQKILNWRQSLRFPAKPRVSREAQDLILSLLCEKEARLGSRGNARPNSVIQRQRSGFLNVTGASTGLAGVANDGAEDIKAHPWFSGIDWSTLHLQTPPFQPQLATDTDTKYFEDDIEDVPLPAPEIAPGVPAPENVRDPMLRHAVHGEEVLEVRKNLAFNGWTFKKPKKQVYDPRRGLDLSSSGGTFGQANVAGTYRDRADVRSDGVGSSFTRSLSV
ncbi:hypothetical protein JCM10212_003916 [Sporobolomyces blumeae]